VDAHDSDALDVQIDYLTSVLTTASAEEMGDVHIALARRHAARAGDPTPGSAPDRDVAAAVWHSRAALASLPPDEPTADTAAFGLGTELRLILGLGVADQFAVRKDRLDPVTETTVASVRSSRDEAIAMLTTVAGELPVADPDWVTAADALGRTLHDRYADPWPGAAEPDPADLDRAVDLLLAAVAAEPEPGTVGYLVSALSDRLDLRDDPADLDNFITWGQRLSNFCDPADADDNFLRELVSAALMDRADANPQTRDTDLDAAIGHLETALAALPAGDSGQASLLTSMAHACWRRLDGDASDYGLVDKMTAYAERAWPLPSLDTQDRLLIGLYLATGVHERLIRPQAPFELAAVSHAIEVLTEIEPLVADQPDGHLFAVVTLGHFLVARGQVTGAVADLTAAQPFLLRAAAELDTSDPSRSELTQTLAVAMTVLANLGMDADHLDPAIALLTAAASMPHPDPARAAMTRGALGALLVQRAGFTASWRDLDAGISHLVASHDLAPAGHAYRAETGVNLAGALLMRFLERGQAEDVDAARFYLTMADALAGPAGDEGRSLMADADVVLAGNKGLLGVACGLRGDTSALDEAVSSLRAALSGLPSGHPLGERIRSDLGLALALRAMSVRSRPTDLAEAARQLGIAVAALPGAHVMRPLALLRTGAALAGAASAAGDQHLLRLAIGYLTGSVGQLDPRFGGRYRFAAVIGTAALALYRLSGDAADLDGAISRLEEARRELGRYPYHPQYANVMINLAYAYRARGDAKTAHETGLAALRARARDLLLQSGTARSIGFARLAAAEATQIAGWCMDDRKPAAAVGALEFGRGLILHAATSVTGFADLLAAAGHEELAREWQDAAEALHDTPWDAGVPGAAHLPGLVSGTISLDIPDDLRARAFAAVAGSHAEQRLLAPPSAAELAAALAETGADALVYLLGPADGRPERAVLVPAAGLTAVAEPAELPLPGSGGAADDLIGRYVSAYAAVVAAGDSEQAAADIGAVGRWQHALGELCEWAGRAVMQPLLRVMRTWELGRLPRVVLIPVGVMSLIPWHAARAQPSEKGHVSFILQEMVVSYAASGRQLREVAGRAALPLESDAVVVGDPTGTLPKALAEAQAIASRHYPAGRYLGSGAPGWERGADGAGTPAEVLRQLPAVDRSGASMLHLGCHGVVADSAPGRSHLLLAADTELRVDAILQQASGRPPSAAGGLVSLAACSSDLAADEYDEALTPATAFLAAGAVTVVGARWQVPDAATAQLMFMFHHFMTRRAYSARDALRSAQLWMLDPARIPPAEMPPELAVSAGRTRMADVTAWAGFVHQGR
jgi:tetratricopeptide (TPR) repeat protein